MSGFETGARGPVVNELVLYCDNTAELHAKIRHVYMKHVPCPTRQEDIENLMRSFKRVLDAALEHYKKELGRCITDPEEDDDHGMEVTASKPPRRSTGLAEEEKEDFCRIYASEYFSFDVQEMLREKRGDTGIVLDYSDEIGRGIGGVAQGRQVVDPVLLKILGTASVKGSLLYLPGTLDKKTYAKVDAVIELLGGKWNTRKKAHVFAEDPSEKLDVLLATGSVELPTDFEFYPTPAGLAEKMVRLADLRQGMTVLEPEAGDGALADEAAKIVGASNITCVEIQEDKCRVLAQKGYTALHGDFLADFSPEVKFDRVIMNPPFSKAQDILHVRQALKYLKPNGRLTAIMSGGTLFRDNCVTKEFRNLVDSLGGEMIENEAGSFKESGTLVSTICVIFNAPPVENPPHDTKQGIAVRTGKQEEEAAAAQLCLL